MWPGISHAQGFCYLINSEGEVVNLDDICQDRNTPENPQSPEATDPAAQQQGTSSSSEVRSTTITSPTGTSPAVTSGSNGEPAEANPNASDPNTTDPNATDSERSPNAAESPQNTDAETPSETPDSPSETPPDDADDPVDTGPENRLDIPVREIETPEIPQIQTPQRLDSTGDDTDTSTSE
jgi:hypothetical protein